jgi:hypothetical protein
MYLSECSRNGRTGHDNASIREGIIEKQPQFDGFAFSSREFCRGRTDFPHHLYEFHRLYTGRAASGGATFVIHFEGRVSNVSNYLKSFSINWMQMNRALDAKGLQP